ncbi:DUF5916 domain-containing protein [Tamlana sp. 2201CG12-4]|uniref:DUF5916 domain-containing protein n=1 Tax=Tamlana sp. 2201CG12-4 TaxID=3112582 RepID=UPI002DB73263|nr:DUF5916 domain-containing protein [Tamlana sp. 2201CG12-4]MEC3907706.1 DUF5916 domain-containing protein [Tamlana sp. 2201CG12-4]
MKQLTILILLFCISLHFEAQTKKVYQITRTEHPPTIDGILNESTWDNLQIATDFIQFRPDVGKNPEHSKRSEIKMTYDDKAIYIAAYLYDNPDDILRQFTQRDNFGQSDFFGIIFNPNNDAQNNTEFFVFSSGTQADAIESPNIGEDFGWNAVWDSAVKIVEDGWVVEVKIPYRCLRFTQQEDPTWGIQFHRHYRKTRAQFTWNAIDVTKDNFGLYNAELKGLQNIKPPTRLSFYPYASGLVSNYAGETETDFAAGLDLKYGITESFTLDATLIPDFSQAGFDNVELNLGPFEQRFSEQRQFFTEGVDLFNKGNLFYSRRVGNAPTYTPELEDDEEIIDYPEKVQLINAIKISGRTKKGLGIGFFNAITEKTYATIEKVKQINQNLPFENTETTRKKVVVEPLANYNIMVLDQQFNKNSSVTLINTNVTRNGSFKDSNVSGLLFDIMNKKNTYGTFGEVKMSTFNNAPDKSTGYSAMIGAGKNSGKVRYSVEYNYADEHYDINDLGILFRNNYSNYSADISYRIFEPTKRLNNYRINAWFNYRQLASPNTFTGANTGIAYRATNKKLHTFGFNVNWNIGKRHDYFEPRNGFDSFFTTKNYTEGNIWLSSNFNNFFALSANFGYGLIFEKARDNFNNWWFGFNPRFKFNDKFLLVLGFEYDDYTADRGYINGQDVDDNIIFGQRELIETEASISGSYNFNPFNALTLSFRNYLSTVTYDNHVYNLEHDGSLSVSNTHTKYTIGSDPDFNPDVNFNTWNLDLSYSWQFAPGSMLTALYRNQIFNQSNNSKDDYLESLGHLFDQEKRNTFSLRLVYFIDYNDIKNTLRTKTKS